MQIHYDRIGKDGFFSHKEITVIFVPDLSECLPSLDAWRDQWLAHKKAVAERERQLSLRKEVSCFIVYTHSVHLCSLPSIIWSDNFNIKHGLVAFFYLL